MSRCELENIPYEQMWPADAYWWPHFLRGEKFKVPIGP